jgi:hypothetical protein
MDALMDGIICRRTCRLMKMSFKSMDGTNICNQGVLEENIRITNADHSSDNNNANINPRAQQMNQTVIYVDDDNSNADDDYLLTWCYLTYSTMSLMN